MQTTDYDNDDDDDVKYFCWQASLHGRNFTWCSYILFPFDLIWFVLFTVVYHACLVKEILVYEHNDSKLEIAF